MQRPRRDVPRTTFVGVRAVPPTCSKLTKQNRPGILQKFRPKGCLLSRVPRYIYTRYSTGDGIVSRVKRTFFFDESKLLCEANAELPDPRASEKITGTPPDVPWTMPCCQLTVGVMALIWESVVKGSKSASIW